MAPLTLENLGDLPAGCRSCVRWELEPAAADRAVRAGDPAFEKEAWLSSLLLSWGSGGGSGGERSSVSAVLAGGGTGAGRVAYVADEFAGYVSVAPPAWAPRAATLPTAPVSADAVLLVAGHVVPAHRGAGIARMLVQGVAKDLTQRGVRALEAFGVAPRAGDATAAPQPPGSTACMVPQDFLEAVGFTVVRPHHAVPRLRLDLRSALAWREDVEAALDQLLGSLTPAGH